MDQVSDFLNAKAKMQGREFAAKAVISKVSAENYKLSLP
jgi:hypothetical protein